MINGAFGIAQATVAFIRERLLVNRDRAAGVYSVGPYFMARTLVDMPLQVCGSCLYVSVLSCTHTDVLWMVRFCKL